MDEACSNWAGSQILVSAIIPLLAAALGGALAILGGYISHRQVRNHVREAVAKMVGHEIEHIIDGTERLQIPDYIQWYLGGLHAARANKQRPSRPNVPSLDLSIPPVFAANLSQFGVLDTEHIRRVMEWHAMYQAMRAKLVAVQQGQTKDDDLERDMVSVLDTWNKTLKPDGRELVTDLLNKNASAKRP